MYDINTQKINEKFHEIAVTGVEVKVEGMEIKFL